MSRIYNKNITSLKTVVHDTSVVNAQKILVKPAGGEASERVDILDIIDDSAKVIDNRIEDIEKIINGDYEPINFTTNTSGKSNETEGIGIQYSKLHFIPVGAQLRTVELPYTRETFNLSNQYCHIQYYNSSGEVIETHISTNTQNRTSGTTGVSSWTFDESSIVPEYSYVRVLVSGVNYPVNFGITSKFRINVVNINGVTFDDDECCVWANTSSSSNYLGDISVIYAVIGDTLIEKINVIKTSLENSIDEVNNTVSDIDSRVDIIEEELGGEYNVENTFNTNTVGGTTDNASVTAIQYSKAHFINNAYLSKLTLPYTYQSTTANTAYLLAQIFSDDETIIDSVYSNESCSFNQNETNSVTFTFTNLYIPADYKFIRFIPTANTSTIPNVVTNVNTVGIRCHPIKFSDNFEFDDDDCLCYVNGNIKNWLINATLTYKTRGASLKDRVTALEEKTPDEYPFITEEAAAETYLSKTEASETYLAKEGNNNLAKLDEVNTFTAANTFEEVVTINNGAMISGNVFVSNGVLTFEDLVDGTVIESNGATGYCYVQEMPITFNNGICYDIGEISDSTDLSSVRFSAEGRLVQTCELWFTTSATPSTKHKWPTGIYWIDSATGAAPTLIASKNYRLVFRQEPNKIIASIAYLY